jgi:hypothetical protein
VEAPSLGEQSFKNRSRQAVTAYRSRIVSGNKQPGAERPEAGFLAVSRPIRATFAIPQPLLQLPSRTGVRHS